MENKANIYVVVTDNDWYDYLAENQPDELNFWQPDGKQVFRALQHYGLFLFKLHRPSINTAKQNPILLSAALDILLFLRTFMWK